MPLLGYSSMFAQSPTVEIQPTREETVTAERIDSIHAKVKRQRKVDSAPAINKGILTFTGSTDGNQQVDPQIAVGKNHVLHGTNSGFTIFDKSGKYLDGVRQNGFKGGIDPKLLYNRHHDVFAFDLWVYWDEPKTKPIHISVSETGDPTQAWNTYSIPAPQGRDGGAIGHSHQWIGYSFPGGPEQTFVMPIKDCIAGVSTTVYHFSGNLGHPVSSQDKRDGLLFFRMTNKNFIIHEIVAGKDGKPVAKKLCQQAHNLKYIQYPPQSPQKNSDKTTASGDRNPKAIVVQNGCLWFSRTVKCNGRSAVQWHQINLDGTTVQSGMLQDEKRSYIQSTLAVNDRQDVLVGFQETGPDMFISPRMAFRKASDPAGELRPIISLGEGKAAMAGGAWGDYSGSTIDGGNGIDLWTVQSIADDTGKGDTVIAKMPLQDE